MAEERWWNPDRFAARLPYLLARAAIMDTIRSFFRKRNFLEVATPALQVSPGLEPHLRAFATEFNDPVGTGIAETFYLHTSPEFAMKKLLVAGTGNIFQIAHAFRDGERSATHHPEFTMLEWYRTGATYRDLMEDCEALLRACLAAGALAGDGARPLYRNATGTAAPDSPWEYLTVAEAFRRHAGIDIRASTPDPQLPTPDLLAVEAARIGIRTAGNDSWEDIFFRIFLDRIEPRLGIGAPTILYDYPISMAALSRPRTDDPAFAERFEVFVCGLELANGFSELTDAAEQRRRFEADIEKRRVLFGDAYPVDEDFMAALDHGMPESAGIAMGVDRLVMLATGADDIEQVLWAPVTGALR